MAGVIELGADNKYDGITHSQSWLRALDGASPNPGSGMGSLVWRRSYSGASDPQGASSWANSSAAIDQGLGITASWISYKGSLATMIAGGYDNAMQSLIDTCPPAPYRIIYTFRHEPENDAGIDAVAWRNAQKHAHWYFTQNKGQKLIDVAPNLMGYTFNPNSNRTVSDWVPVYQQGDTIPGGWSVDDPAFDMWTMNVYKDGGSYNNVSWDGTGAPDGGVDGHIDDLVTAINYWRINKNFTRSDLYWAIGEIGNTVDSGTTERDWFEDMVFGARDDPEALCGPICWFNHSGDGFGTEFLMGDSTQDWINANGDTFDGGGGGGDPEQIGSSQWFTYDVEAGEVEQVGSTSPLLAYDVFGPSVEDFTGWGVPI